MDAKNIKNNNNNKNIYDMIPGGAQYKNGCLFSLYLSGLFIV